MNRGAVRQKIFLDEGDYQFFINLLEDTFKKWRVELYAYCLMGNHYHLCFKTPEAKLSRIMRHINGLYTQHFNRAHGRDGPLFRGRYKAMVIEEEDYLHQVVRYIHLNPVDAGISEMPEDYPWSSHKIFLSKKNIRWFSKEKIMEWFEGPQSFHEFVLEGNDSTLNALYKRKRWPVILGGESFIENIRLASDKPSKEHVRAEKQFIRPSLEKVLTAVANEFGVTITQIIQGRRGQTNLSRKVALWILKEHGDYTHEQLARTFALGSGKTVGWACKEVKGKMDIKLTFKNRIKKIQNQISQPET